MNQLLPQLHDIWPVLPELALAFGAMLMLMLGVMVGEKSAAFVNGVCVLVLIGVGAILATLPVGRYEMFGGSFVVDDFARFLKLLTLTGSAGALILSLDYLTLEKQQKFEFGALVLLSTLGMLLHRPTLLIGEQHSLREAADLMVETGVGRLVVVDEADPSRMTGFLTRGDLLAAHARRLRETREAARTIRPRAAE